MNLPSPFSKRKDTFDYEAAHTCKVCGTEFKGRFCNRCGEKIVEPAERSVLAFIESQLNAFTFLEGKFFRTVKLMVIQPGQLSRNISDGIQVPYMRMVSLFYLASFFYFFLFVFDAFNSSLNTQMNYLNWGGHSEQVKQLVDQHIASEGTTIAEFTARYEGQSTNLSKFLLIILALMMAVVSSVVNYSKKLFFYDHVLFAMEFYSFQILINLVLLANLIKYMVIFAHTSLGLNWSILLSDNVFSLTGNVLLAYFVVRSEQNFFKQKWYWAVAKSIVMLVLIFVTLALYRRMLFYVTMATI